MGSTSESCLVVLLGLVLLLIGLGYLPVPRRIRNALDEETCETYREALRWVGPLFIALGVALLFRPL